MRNTGLDELQAEMKIGGKSINNLRCVDYTTLKEESKEELMHNTHSEPVTPFLASVSLHVRLPA